MSEALIEDPFAPSPEIERRFSIRTQEAMLDKGQVLNGRVKIIDDVRQLQDAASQFRKDNEDLGRQLRKEANRGCMADVSGVPENFRLSIDELLSMFPNFEEVINKIRSEMILASLTNSKVFKLEIPLLLVGPAGVGKTYFLNEFAERMELLTERISCSDSTAGFALSGLSSGYGTGQPGLVYKTIINKRIANPILILDEIDKATKGYSAGNPPFESIFYNLLEPMSARNYKDECMTVEFDASHICWVATANDLSVISSPIRDRFEIVNIPYPSKSQRKHICKNIYTKMVSSQAWGERFSKEIEDDVISMLTSGDISVRQIKKNLLQAFAKAAEENETRGRSQRKKIKVCRSHFKLAPGVDQKPRIGFIH